MCCDTQRGSSRFEPPHLWQHTLAWFTVARLVKPHAINTHMYSTVCWSKITLCVFLRPEGRNLLWGKWKAWNVFTWMKTCHSMSCLCFCVCLPVEDVGWMWGQAEMSGSCQQSFVWDGPLPNHQQIPQCAVQVQAEWVSHTHTHVYLAI